MWIASQADAIIANLRTTTMNNQQDKDEEPTILVAADTVCFVFAFFPFFPVLRCFRCIGFRLVPLMLEDTQKLQCFRYCTWFCSKWETGCFPYAALIGKLLGLVSTQGWWASFSGTFQWNNNITNWSEVIY